MKFKGRIPLPQHWTRKEIKTLSITFHGVKIGEAQIDGDGNVTKCVAEKTPDQLKQLCYEMVMGHSIKRN